MIEMSILFKRYRFLLVILAAVLAVTTCKKQIPIQATTGVKNYLVVSGNISINDTSLVNLSRLVGVADSSRGKAEVNATVTVEGQQSGTYTLTSRSNGNYVLPPSNLPASQNYRLHIKTADGAEYASDYVQVKNSPAIDTVNYTANASGVNINVNTHDASNNTHYYRWDYVETYMIQEPYYSHYKTVNHDTILKRSPEEQVYQCWPSDSSSNIIIGTSINLSKDQISSQLLTTIPATSDKIHIRYSILVKQYALTPDAYNYFTLLKKNTEQLGSIFDSQPSLLTGNIHCISNPSQLAIGYITAGQVTQQRIFIDASSLPAYNASLPYGTCEVDTLLYLRVIPSNDNMPDTQPTKIPEVYDLLYSGVKDPIDSIGAYPSGGFTGSWPVCVDCSLRGTNKKPSFWK